LAIELDAAMTLGYYILIGTIYFLLLIIIEGRTPKGNEILPITFYIILSACWAVIPPVYKAGRFNLIFNYF
jgi:hypothetical protein